MGYSRISSSDEQLDEEIWLNHMGTFGIGHAWYWWGRAEDLLVRLSHCYMPRYLRALRLLPYADDGHVTASGPKSEAPILVHLLFFELLGTPLKWRKV